MTLWVFVLSTAVVFLVAKTHNLQKRVARMEMDVQRFMLRVIYGKQSDE